MGYSFCNIKNPKYLGIGNIFIKLYPKYVLNYDTLVTHYYISYCSALFKIKA